MESRADRALAVLDTKYKSDIEPEPGDIEQIIAYSVSISTSEILLVYPYHLTRHFDLTVGKDVRVRGLTFDISMKPEIGGIGISDPNCRDL